MAKRYSENKLENFVKNSDVMVGIFVLLSIQSWTLKKLNFETNSLPFSQTTCYLQIIIVRPITLRIKMKLN